MATYPLLEIEDFGRQLIVSQDLDPVYAGLVGAGMERDQLKRWLVAYWCFYSAGAACWMSEQQDSCFWVEMEVAATNALPTPLGGRWPRAAERRHFRGAQAVNAVRYLLERWPAPEAMVDYIAHGEDGPTNQPEKFTDVFNRTAEHTGFGPWISFKACDMLERCCDVPMVFEQAHIFLFKDPALAVDMLWEKRVSPIARSKLDANERRARVIAELIKTFADLPAPPLVNTGFNTQRSINIQEVETVLCKWKSHQNGHYPVGKDTREVRHGLAEWAPHCDTARNMLKAMP